MAIKLMCDCHALEPRMLADALQFYSATASWLLSLLKVDIQAYARPLPSPLSCCQLLNSSRFFFASLSRRTLSVYGVSD